MNFGDALGWGLLIVFFIVPVILLFGFFASRDLIKGSGSVQSDARRGVQEIQLDEMGQNEYVPKTMLQEMQGQLIQSVKFGIFVQFSFALGLFIIIVFSPLIIRQTTPRADSQNIFVAVYIITYLLSILYGYHLVKNRMAYSGIIVFVSTLFMGVAMTILYVLSQASPPTGLGETPHTVDFIFSITQILGMTIFAPITTLVLYPALYRRAGQ